MHIHLSYVAARERESGKVFFLAESAELVGGRANALIAPISAEFCAPDENGRTLRAKYSHVLVVIDNNVRDHFEFPDPLIAKREKLRLAVANAETEAASAKGRADQAKVAADNAKSLASKAKDAATHAANLRKELDALPAPLPSAPLVTGLEPHVAAPVPAPASPPAVTPNQVAADEELRAEMLALDGGSEEIGPQLADVAKQYDLKLEDFKSKVDLIGAIILAAG